MRAIVSVLVVVLFACLSASAQSTVSLGGYCDTVSNPGLTFVPYGLGQQEVHTTGTSAGQSFTDCTFGPGNPVSIYVGTVLTTNGTVRNLYVKQSPLNGAPMAGTVRIWVNPKTGGAPVQTSITCSISFQGGQGIYGCNDTLDTYAVVAGDKVIAIVTPPAGQSMSPVTVTVDVTTTATSTIPLSGHCYTVSNPGAPFVLRGLGQRRRTSCDYEPGSPTVSLFLGEPITRSGTLKNLYVKQTQLNFAPLGGTVTVWVNKKTGGSPVQTTITCSITTYQGIYGCSNTANTYAVVPGDKVIVIVTPPGGTSISPVVATLDY